MTYNANGDPIEKRLEDELNGKSNPSNQNNANLPNDPNGADPSKITVDKKYKLPDGRELSGDQVLDEYGKLLGDHTKKSQELSELHKKIDNNPVDDPLKDLTADEKEIAKGLGAILPKLGYVKRDDVLKEIDTKKQEIVGEAGNFAEVKIKLKSDLDTVGKEFDGSTENGVVKPKVDREKILNFIKDNGAVNLSVPQIARVLDPETFAKYDVAKMQAGGGSNLPATEGAGAGVVTPPGVKYSFGDGSAERAVREILGADK